MTEQDFGTLCLLSLLTVGPLLIWLGARAAGLGVLASVVGAFVGALTTRTIDELASYVPIGATVALFVGGSAGLFWRSWARRSTLLTIGMVIAALGIAVTLVVEGSIIARGRTLIGDMADPTMRVLVPLDAAFVVLLCLVQPVQAATPSESPSSNAPVMTAPGSPVVDR